MIKAPLEVRIKVSLYGVANVLAQPLYVILALSTMLVTSALLLWSLNLGLLRYVVFEAPIGLGQKIDFFFSVFRDLYTTYSGLVGTGIVVFSLLFGVNTAVLVYVIRGQGIKKVPKKSSTLGLVFAVIGGGCVACGTSIITPLLATVGAGSASLLGDISAVLNWLGAVLVLYSIYKLGLVAKTIQTQNSLQKD